MPVTDSLHRTLRGLVAAALRSALRDAGYAFRDDGVREQDAPRPELLDRPGVAVSEGIPTKTGGGTNARDAKVFPVFLGMYTVGGDRPTAAPPGVEPGRFLEIVDATFHNRRLAGAPNNVLLGEVQVMAPPYDETEPSFAGLRTAAVVSFTAWVARGS